MTKRLLLFKTTPNNLFELTPTTEEWDSADYIPKKLDCNFFTRVESRMRKIILGDGREIKFNMWVDEEGVINKKKPNLKATLITDPLAEARGEWRILGNCIMEPYDDTPLQTGDWKLIENALWNDEKLVEKNCKVNNITL